MAAGTVPDTSKNGFGRKEGWNRESYTESTHTSNLNFNQNKVSFRDDYLRGHLSAGVPGRSRAGILPGVPGQHKANPPSSEEAWPKPWRRAP